MGNTKLEKKNIHQFCIVHPLHHLHFLIDFVQQFNPFLQLFFSRFVLPIFLWTGSYLANVASSDTHTPTAPSGKTSLIDLALVSNLEVLLNCSTVSTLETMDAHSYHNCVRLTLRWKHKHCKQVLK